MHVNIHKWHTPASDILASFRPLEEEPSFHHSLRVLCLLLVPRLHGQCVYNRNPYWSRVFPILRQIVIQRAMFDVVGVEGQLICRILSRFRLFQFLKGLSLQWQSHANPLHRVLKLLEQLLFRNNLHLEAHLWHVDHGNVTMSLSFLTCFQEEHLPVDL